MPPIPPQQVRRFWNKLFRQYNERMEDPNKVAAKLRVLNAGKPDKPWVAVDGNNVLPQANSVGRGYKFNYERGYIVKLFVNSKTGEVRSYVAIHFEYKHG